MNIRNNIELKPYNSLRTKALAKLFCEPESVSELSEIIKLYPNEKKLVIGGGFNLFFTKNFDGLVIHPNMKDTNVWYEDENVIEIEVYASEKWDDFVEYCVKNNYAGLENLSYIPSSVGAAPVQNIGAYGTEVKDIITLVRTMDIHTGETKDFTNEMCEFDYRSSIFKRTDSYVITSVVFRLNKSFTYKEKYIDLTNELIGNKNPSMREVRNAIIRIRTRKLPDYNSLPNAGSFFKNPIITYEQKEKLLKVLPNAIIHNVNKNCFKTSSAFLIDKAGYKNKRYGMVGTYKHHSLIIVNYGTEKGKDILDFMEKIQKNVHSQFNIWLEPEVQMY
ncbi:MAG TPA: UDP-N-acetylmuramate dehydrogenase [Dysgonamonadaceae bacterium]|nr:UDP-N-acetylmuramate dehydrogenase [Dysgonamonadaceae bacterium]